MSESDVYDKRFVDQTVDSVIRVLENMSDLSPEQVTSPIVAALRMDRSPPIASDTQRPRTDARVPSCVPTSSLPPPPDLPFLAPPTSATPRRPIEHCGSLRGSESTTLEAHATAHGTDVVVTAAAAFVAVTDYFSRTRSFSVRARLGLAEERALALTLGCRQSMAFNEVASSVQARMCGGNSEAFLAESTGQSSTSMQHVVFSSGHAIGAA
eukprot:4173414-Pleurochrysis_carterae.AAC.1